MWLVRGHFSHNSIAAKSCPPCRLPIAAPGTKQKECPGDTWLGKGTRLPCGKQRRRGGAPTHLTRTLRSPYCWRGSCEGD